MNPNRVTSHKYLGMIFDFTETLTVKINMYDYVERIINEFPIKISKSYMDLTPAGNNLFEKGNSKILVLK